MSLDVMVTARQVSRRQYGRGGPSLSEEMLLRHSDDVWPCNIYYGTGIWNKLNRLGLVTGTAAASRLTSYGYSVREHILRTNKARGGSQ